MELIQQYDQKKHTQIFPNMNDIGKQNSFLPLDTTNYNRRPLCQNICSNSFKTLQTNKKSIHETGKRHIPAFCINQLRDVKLHYLDNAF